MLKVIIYKGLPASGKSTDAKLILGENPNSYKRINKDDLRAMLDDSKHSDDAEKFVLQVRDILILKAIENGKHVLIDDINLAPKHEIRIRELVKGKAEVIIKDFTNVPVEVCIKRDLKRLNSVGEAVIRKMHKQFLEKKEEYIEDENLPKAILVDIDGTLAMMNDRSPFDWSKVGEDSCNGIVKRLVNDYEGRVIVMSGRDGVCRKETIEWLRDNEIDYDLLFMREQGNSEKDSIVKRRLFEENVRGKYFIEYVLDDRNQVVEMWRGMGLICLQVAEGNF